MVFFIDGVFEGLGYFEMFMKLVVFFMIRNVNEFNIL